MAGRFINNMRGITMPKNLNLSFRKLAIITLLITFVVSVWLTYNISEHRKITEKNIQIEAIEDVTGNKKQA